MATQTTAETRQLESEIEFQRKNWVFERLGWFLMAATIVAAVLGLFGHGAFSVTSNRTPDRKIMVSYDRLERYQAPAVLHVSVAPEAVQGKYFKLQFNRSFIRNVELQDIVPQPVESELGNATITYRFSVAPEAGPKTVSIYYEPDMRGWLPIVVGLENGIKLQIRQFVYP